MHPYAIDSNERFTALTYIGAVSVALAFGLDSQLAALQIKPWWFVDTPSVLGFMGLLVVAFENYGWRVAPLRWLGMANAPNLNGQWSGYIKSGYDNYQSEVPVTICIRQTWVRISVELRTEYSRSRSVIAGILTNDGVQPGLIYEYLNTPLPTAVETMHAHHGLAKLRLMKEDGSQVLEGEYYSGRGRLVTGVIRVSKHGVRPIPVEPESC